MITDQKSGQYAGSKFVRIVVSAGVLVSLIALGAYSAAPMPSTSIAMTAWLSGTSDVPASISTGSGSVDATLDSQTQVLSWTITYAGLSGPVKGGSFHRPATATRSDVLALAMSGNLANPITGTATLTAAQAAELSAGKWSVNLHTVAHPNGEVRGQVVVRP